ncbi:hypothetical protein ACE1ET_12410 [Saccharicrinis sp. FJH62]|uniref:hypothetical protein n=1 Tax=Saccharicrinis sp. FJH62 TaxID=3344657 RepID=UPI0035D4E1FF
MKNITITPKHLKTELIVFASLFILSFLANVYAIITYHTEWSELYTSLFYVLTICAILYVSTGVFRLIIILILKSLKRK